MNRCFRCGAKIKDGYTLCRVCVKKLHEDDSRDCELEEEYKRGYSECERDIIESVEQMDTLVSKYEVIDLINTGYTGYKPSKPKGHWIQIENFDTWTHNYACSECDGRVLCCRLDMPRFCGFCGAEMEIDKSKGQLYAD